MVEILNSFNLDKDKSETKLILKQRQRAHSNLTPNKMIRKLPFQKIERYNEKNLQNSLFLDKSSMVLKPLKIDENHMNSVNKLVQRITKSRNASTTLQKLIPDLSAQKNANQQSEDEYYNQIHEQNTIQQLKKLLLNKQQQVHDKIYRYKQQYIQQQNIESNSYFNTQFQFSNINNIESNSCKNNHTKQLFDEEDDEEVIQNGVIPQRTINSILKDLHKMKKNQETQQLKNLIQYTRSRTYTQTYSQIKSPYNNKKQEIKNRSTSQYNINNNSNSGEDISINKSQSEKKQNITEVPQLNFEFLKEREEYSKEKCSKKYKITPQIYAQIIEIKQQETASSCDSDEYNGILEDKQFKNIEQDMQPAELNQSGYSTKKSSNSQRNCQVEENWLNFKNLTTEQICIDNKQLSRISSQNQEHEQLIQLNQLNTSQNQIDQQYQQQDGKVLSLSDQLVLKKKTKAQTKNNFSGIHLSKTQQTQNLLAEKAGNFNNNSTISNYGTSDQIFRGRKIFKRNQATKQINTSPLQKQQWDNQGILNQQSVKRDNYKLSFVNKFKHIRSNTHNIGSNNNMSMTVEGMQIQQQQFKRIINQATNNNNNSKKFESQDVPSYSKGNNTKNNFYSFLDGKRFMSRY